MAEFHQGLKGVGGEIRSDGVREGSVFREGENGLQHLPVGEEPHGDGREGDSEMLGKRPVEPRVIKAVKKSFPPGKTLQCRPLIVGVDLLDDRAQWHQRPCGQLVVECAGVVPDDLRGRSADDLRPDPLRVGPDGDGDLLDPDPVSTLRLDGLVVVGQNLEGLPQPHVEEGMGKSDRGHSGLCLLHLPAEDLENGEGHDRRDQAETDCVEDRVLFHGAGSVSRSAIISSTRRAWTDRGNSR